ncbi:MAG: hypothetical protein NTW05_09340 [Pseudonocardiales bacterium]|nr:hypothetical protein [Pseudonocardiales bacterium]
MSTVPTPAAYHEIPRRELLDQLAAAELVLVDSRHGIGTPRTPTDVRQAALGALAIARALAALLLRFEWVAQLDALRAGATLGEVAAACGLDVDEVLAGLRSRLAGQVEHGVMPREVVDELHRLIDGAELTRRLFERHGNAAPPA